MKRDLRFAIVPKIAHPWFDEVHTGALVQARLLKEQLGVDIAIKEGILESSAATIPRLQGSMSVLMLWQASLGGRLPRTIDTGIDVITGENVDSFLSAL